MNIPHPPSTNAPRKELINSLQKGVLVLLLVLSLVFVGLYALMNVNLQEQSSEQERLSELIEGVHGAEEHWLQWMLIEERNLYNNTVLTSTHYHNVLVSEYRLIEQKLIGFDVPFDIAQPLALLERIGQQKSLESYLLSSEEREIVYVVFSALENLNDELLKIGVDLDYERELFFERLLWAPIGALFLLAFLVIFIAVKFSRQLGSGFSSLHYILDHHKHGHALLVPSRSMSDEFTDLGHYIDNELESRNFDTKQKNAEFDLIEKSLSQISEPFFVTSSHGDIVWMSSGAEKLWFKNTEVFESMFGIDSGLDSPVGESVSESFLLNDEEINLKLSDGVYCLGVKGLGYENESEDLQYFISLKLKSEMAEIDILHHSLKLMGQDVWSVPIRALRHGSPYESFAVSLEAIRERVFLLMDAMNEELELTPTFEKITKLQQIASLIDEKNNHNVLSSTDISVVPESFVENDNAELNEIVLLAEQIRDSLLLGYELMLQRLALVERDLSSDVFLLEDVDRCLNEVRAGVLSSLSATEGEDINIKRRFSIDIEHDISVVQSQISDMKSMAASTLTLLETDQSVGLCRLNKASSSIDEIIEKIHRLMQSIPKISSEDDSVMDRSNDASDDFEA